MGIMNLGDGEQPTYYPNSPREFCAYCGSLRTPQEIADHAAGCPVVREKPKPVKPTRKRKVK